MELPDDDKKMSKHVGVWILYRHCCDTHFGYINCAFVGYNKTFKKSTTIVCVYDYTVTL